MAFLRIASAVRPALRASAVIAPRARVFAVRNYSDAHAEESFEEFSAR